jgi:hypothetical protein
MEKWSKLATFILIGVAGLAIAACSQPVRSETAFNPQLLPTLAAAVPVVANTVVPTATITGTMLPMVVKESPATPTETPWPTATVTPPTAGVHVYSTTVSLRTYPFRDFLNERVDPLYNIPVFHFKRSDYDRAGPHTPVLTDFKGIVLENDYLRLTFLPELGGRLYSAVTKATGQEIFYHNPVVKPSIYGVLKPPEENWWLATGGMDWAYPTQEHGYRFGIPWSYQVEQTAESATLILSDTGPDRVGLDVRVSLPANKALFSVAPRLVNNSSQSAPVQLWVNAALTLGAKTMSPNTRFVMPADRIIIHSRGGSGWTLPEAKQSAPWPRIGQIDLRDYKQWADYLGFFVPNQAAPFLGAYNPETNLGVVRLASGPPGSGKLFAFGQNFSDRSYTDDNSQYFEIWGGANAGFWAENDIAVAAGESLSWQEQWWPLAQLGGLTWATEHAAVHLTGDNLSVLVSTPTQGRLQIRAGNQILLDEAFTAEPTTPLSWPLPATATTVEILNQAGQSLLSYQIN